MELLIREAQASDAEAIVNILNPIIETGLYSVLDTPFTVEAERDFILNFPQRGIFHVAEQSQNGTLVGFQSMEPFADYTRAFDHVAIIGTYVALSHQRQGIANRMFKATFEAARRKKYKKIFTYVRADNPAALATYLNQGFHIVGTAHKQARVKDSYVDEIIIERFL